MITSPVVKAQNLVKNGRIGRDGTSSTMAVMVEADPTTSLLSSRPVLRTSLLPSAQLWPGTRCRGRIGCPTSYFFLLCDFILSYGSRRWASKTRRLNKVCCVLDGTLWRIGVASAGQSASYLCYPLYTCKDLPFAFSIPMDIFAPSTHYAL